MIDDACRIDVWLWRARFFKTRSLAARIVEDGGVRLTRSGARSSVDKPSRAVRRGDVLAFAQGARWLAVRVEALGERRGPATEARALYSLMEEPGGRSACGLTLASEPRARPGDDGGRISKCSGRKPKSGRKEVKGKAEGNQSPREGNQSRNGQGDPPIHVRIATIIQ